MKPIRSLLIFVFFSVIIFSSVIYSACHKDKCHNVNCLNGSVCDAGGCICPVGYQGLRCELLSRDKFIANFNGHDLCNKSDTNYYLQYHVEFVTIPAKPTEFLMKNFVDNMDDSAICTIRSVDSFSFFGSNNGTTFSGYGTLRKDTLRMSYRVQADTTSYSCKYIGGSLW